MKISRGSAYAVYGLRYLAIKGLNEKITIAEIATSFNLPEKHMAKIFQGLAKTRLVNSVRGINGGFMLAVDPAEINLLEIIEAVEGPFDLEGCMLRYGPCDFYHECKVCDHLRGVQSSLVSVMSKVRLVDLMQEDTDVVACAKHLIGVPRENGDADGAVDARALAAIEKNGSPPKSAKKDRS